MLNKIRGIGLVRWKVLQNNLLHNLLHNCGKVWKNSTVISFSFIFFYAEFGKDELTCRDQVTVGVKSWTLQITKTLGKIVRACLRLKSWLLEMRHNVMNQRNSSYKIVFTFYLSFLVFACFSSQECLFTSDRKESVLSL